jgi:hypothetical protein
MDFFSTRNLVIVALVQIGVIVLGTLTAGACLKWYASFNLMSRPPLLTTLLADYGFLALALPVAWLAIALYLNQRNKNVPGYNMGMLVTGVLLLVVCLFVVCSGAVSPLLRLMGI